MLEYNIRVKWNDKGELEEDNAYNNNNNNNSCTNTIQEIVNGSTKTMYCTKVTVDENNFSVTFVEGSQIATTTATQPGASQSATQLISKSTDNNSSAVSADKLNEKSASQSTAVPASQPVEKPFSETADERVENHVTQPATESVTQTSIETPATESVTQTSAENPAAQPVTQTSAENPAAQPVTQTSVKNPTAQSVIQTSIENPAAKSVTQSKEEPVSPSNIHLTMHAPELMDAPELSKDSTAIHEYISDISSDEDSNNLELLLDYFKKELDITDKQDSEQKGGTRGGELSISRDEIKFRINVFKNTINKLKQMFYSNHNFIKLVSLKPEDVIKYFTEIIDNSATPKHKLYIEAATTTTTPASSNYHKIEQVKLYLNVFIHLTFVDITSLFRINDSTGVLNRFAKIISIDKTKNATNKMTDFMQKLYPDTKQSDKIYIYAPDMFAYVEQIFANTTEHAPYMTQNATEYQSVAKELLVRFKYLLTNAVGTKSDSNSSTIKKDLFDKMDLASNADFVAGIDDMLQKNSDNNILTFVKFRGNKNNNNIRFNIETNHLMVTKARNNQILKVEYNDDNTAYYDANGNALTDVRLENIEKSGTSGLKVTKYTNKYYLGKFTRVFLATKKNAEIADSMPEVIDKLLGGKTVFIVGYGASGAGKTSTLIQLNTKEKQEPGIVMHICNKIGDKYPKVTLKTTEIFVSNVDPVILENPPVEFDFTSDKGTSDKGFTLTNRYTHTNNHLYRNANNATTDFAAGTSLGTVLTHMIDVDRFVKATTNNPQSSRSHVLAYLTFTGNGGEKINLIVGDFAGVENAFECDKPEIQNRFSNLKKNASNDLFYQFKSGVNPDPVGKLEKQDIATDGIWCTVPYQIYDFDNINSFVRSDKEQPEFADYSYSQFASELKEQVDNLKRVVAFVKNNPNMDALANYAEIRENGYLQFATGLLKMDSEATLNNEKQRLELENASIAEQIKKLGKSNYDLWVKKLEKEKPKAMNIPLNNQTETGELKQYFNYIIDFTDNQDLKNIIRNINDNFPYNTSNKNVDRMKTYQGILDGAVKSLNEYLTTPVSESIIKNILSTSNKNTDKPTFFMVSNAEFRTLLTSIVSALIQDATQKRNNKDNLINDLNTKLAHNTQQISGMKQKFQLINRLKNGDCPNEAKDLVEVIGKMYETHNKLFQTTLDEFGIDKPKCVTTLLDSFDKNLQAMFANPANFIETIQKIKQITDNIEKETQCRSGNIKTICETRTNEGAFINKSLKDLRNSIQQIVAHRNKDVLNITPNFIVECLNEYCPSRNGCFKLPESTAQLNDESVIINNIAKTLFNGDLTGVYDNLLVSVFCVVNLERTANNPPPVPYVDINALKKMFYYKTMYANPLEFIKTLKSTIEKLGSYEDKLGEIINSDNTTQVQRAIDMYREYLTDATRADEFKKEFELGLLSDTTDKKPGQIKTFIESIDNSNAASAMGTLEFVDTISKYSSVDNICSTVNDKSFINGYVSVIDGVNSKSGGGERRQTNKYMKSKYNVKTRNTTKKRKQLC